MVIRDCLDHCSFTRVGSADAESYVLSSDIALHFTCREKVAEEIETQTAGFLIENGFKVLNQGKILREHGFSSYDSKIVGLDSHRRIVEFRSLPRTEGRIAVTFITPPPSQRSASFEKALVAFVTETLGCSVRQISRGENGPDARGIYDSEVRRIEGLFLQAERLRGERHP